MTCLCGWTPHIWAVERDSGMTWLCCRRCGRQWRAVDKNARLTPAKQDVQQRPHR